MKVRRPVLVCVAIAGLGGCAQTAGFWPGFRGGGPPPTATTPAVPADPVLAFAGSANPGAAGTVATSDGVRQVRLVRSYHAASGRECREVAVERPGGAEERRLACAASGGWEWAAPLITGHPAGAAR
ncbi:MAG: DVU3141 family protein [Acetobacteraceae bacterium]|nr:DVU3141 family protein [Acetobacteraceae bacterium]